jgi:ArsR family transcriptional regulator
VTEISDTLMLSPKAVIDHLQMMEREAILSCQMDERRRKYYYLAHDILIDVSLKEVRMGGPVRVEEEEGQERARRSVAMLGRMIKAHDQLLTSLEQINHDIEIKIHDLAQNHKDLFRSERDITVVIALSHEPLTAGELLQVTEIPRDELGEILRRFERRGVLKREKERYLLRGVHAE